MVKEGQHCSLLILQLFQLIYICILTATSNASLESLWVCNELHFCCHFIAQQRHNAVVKGSLYTCNEMMLFSCCILGNSIPVLLQHLSYQHDTMLTFHFNSEGPQNYILARNACRFGDGTKSECILSNIFCTKLCVKDEWVLFPSKPLPCSIQQLCYGNETCTHVQLLTCSSSSYLPVVLLFLIKVAQRGYLVFSELGCIQAQSR